MEQVAVLIPTLRRAHRVAPTVASFEASKPEGATLYFVTTEDDPVADAVRDAGANLILSPGVSYATKVNEAYRRTTEPWLFTGADDIHFHPGWLDEARGLFNRWCVIGTNDLGNRSVTAGFHSTHSFVRRAYADDPGASLDGPGHVLHEGYRHNFVDNELIRLAKQRGVWMPCLASKVEHLHPLWGKGTHDDVYQIGNDNSNQDAKLFKARFGWRGIQNVAAGRGA